MATWPAKINYTTGGILTAAQMNDIGGELNDLYTTAGFAAGKNKIINGDFRIWQRGTSINIAAATYSADRWYEQVVSAVPTGTLSRQTFTPGTAPVVGYESEFFFRCNITATNNSTAIILSQRIEDVRTFAGQTVTVSFWVKTDAATSNNSLYFNQNFGSGGSATVSTAGGTSTFSTTTSWVRQSFTISLPSISGKTVGTGSYLELAITPANSGSFVRVGSFDIWGVQVEAGSVATAFQTATGTIQGELAACQRYYYRIGTGSNYNYSRFGMGQLLTTSTGAAMIKFPVTMRTAPTALEQTGTAANYAISGAGGQVNALTAVPVQDACSTETATWTFTCGTTATAAGQATQFYANNNQTAYLAWSAEL